MKSPMTQSQCELCAVASGKSELSTYEVPQATKAAHGNTALLCTTCREQLENPASIDTNHWHCLNESIWAENPAVKVLAWRVLTLLAKESWAQDLLDQLYLEDDVLEWAQAGKFQVSHSSEAPSQSLSNTRDSNGAALAAGDSVTLIKDLDVKGANFTAKRGLLVKNITLTDDPELIEGRVNGSTIVLKTCFLKKAN